MSEEDLTTTTDAIDLDFEEAGGSTANKFRVIKIKPCELQYPFVMPDLM